MTTWIDAGQSSTSYSTAPTVTATYSDPIVADGYVEAGYWQAGYVQAGLNWTVQASADGAWSVQASASSTWSSA